MSAEPQVIRARFLETEGHFLKALDRNPKKPRIWLIYSIAFPVAAGLILFEEMKQNRRGRPIDWVAVLVPLAALILMAFWMGPIGQRWRIRRSLKKVLGNPPTEAWFEFAKDGFMASGKGGQSSFHPWPTVPSAIRFSDGVLIYYADHDHSFFWIPQSAFASHQDYEAMLDLVTAKVKKFEQSK